MEREGMELNRLRLNQRFDLYALEGAHGMAKRLYSQANRCTLGRILVVGGTVTGGSGGAISSTFEPRIIQFGLKVIY